MPETPMYVCDFGSLPPDSQPSPIDSSPDLTQGGRGNNSVGTQDVAVRRAPDLPPCHLPSFSLVPETSLVLLFGKTQRMEGQGGLLSSAASP